jgi:hypothetical protein
VQRLSIGIRKDSNGSNAHFAAGSDNTKGDFTAIGDKDLFEHEF